jgi:hypothetical protein
MSDSRQALFEKARKRLTVAQALHDFVSKPQQAQAKPQPAMAADATYGTPAPKGGIAHAAPPVNPAQMTGNAAPATQQAPKPPKTFSAAPAKPGVVPHVADAVRRQFIPGVKAATEHDVEVESRYGTGAAARRQARAAFAAKHGEAEADYRTWKPSTVAAAKAAGLFDKGRVPGSSVRDELHRRAKGRKRQRKVVSD